MFYNNRTRSWFLPRTVQTRPRSVRQDILGKHFFRYLFLLSVLLLFFFCPALLITKKFDHITPVLIQLHWLPVHFRILFKVLLLVYKALNGMAPLYITELLSYRTCSRTLRSTDQKLLAVPKSRLKTYGDRAFSVAAPKLWNELPLDLRSLVTINLFKKHLKTDLFKKAYNV